MSFIIWMNSVLETGSICKAIGLGNFFLLLLLLKVVVNVVVVVVVGEDESSNVVGFLNNPNPFIHIGKKTAVVNARRNKKFVFIFLFIYTSYLPFFSIKTIDT